MGGGGKPEAPRQCRFGRLLLQLPTDQTSEKERNACSSTAVRVLKILSGWGTKRAVGARHTCRPERSQAALSHWPSKYFAT